jgi:hypothetical protein
MRVLDGGAITGDVMLAIEFEAYGERAQRNHSLGSPRLQTSHRRLPLDREVRAVAGADALAAAAFAYAVSQMSCGTRHSRPVCPTLAWNPHRKTSKVQGFARATLRLLGVHRQ